MTMLKGFAVKPTEKILKKIIEKTQGLKDILNQRKVYLREFLSDEKFLLFLDEPQNQKELARVIEFKDHDLRPRSLFEKIENWKTGKIGEFLITRISGFYPLNKLYHDIYIFDKEEDLLHVIEVKTFRSYLESSLKIIYDSLVNHLDRGGKSLYVIPFLVDSEDRLRMGDPKYINDFLSFISVNQILVYH